MKSNRWWLKQINFKTWKKWVKSVWLDGVGYPASEWGNVLEQIKAIKIGDPIFNHYKNVWATVAKVEYEIDWFSPYGYEPKIPGSYIAGFVITTEDGFMLYDTPARLEQVYSKGSWYGEYVQPVPLKKKPRKRCRQRVKSLRKR